MFGWLAERFPVDPVIGEAVRRLLDAPPPASVAARPPGAGRTVTIHPNVDVLTTKGRGPRAGR
ncbi:hypothetical protein ABT214_11620 [Micromonospora purpureochromogenes]|uniref:hypothetical protein n=1 Tax=Micromonospora purpureochromogenes TaxID=47872 RepID=UPI0033283576